MQARYGAELHFLVTEFTKMEAQLSMEVTVSELNPFGRKSRFSVG